MNDGCGQDGDYINALIKNRYRLLHSFNDRQIVKMKINLFLLLRFNNEHLANSCVSCINFYQLLICYYLHTGDICGM
jgi:hypothetical protein